MENKFFKHILNKTSEQSIEKTNYKIDIYKFFKYLLIWLFSFLIFFLGSYAITVIRYNNFDGALVKTISENSTLSLALSIFLSAVLELFWDDSYEKIFKGLKKILVLVSFMNIIIMFALTIIYDILLISNPNSIFLDSQMNVNIVFGCSVIILSITNFVLLSFKKGD